jgi:hypothetical protein
MESTINKTDNVPRLAISLEAIIYAVIVAVALALRVVDLGSIPLDNAQAHEALAALRRVDGNVPGDPVAALNPLMAMVNQITFLFFGHSTVAARIGTALIGTFVVLGPLLWRRMLGRIPAVIMSGLLALSPVAITSARTMGGVTWTMAVLFLTGWALLKLWETQQPRFSIMVTMGIGAMVLLTEPTGLITLVGVILGLAYAILSLPTDDTNRQRMLAAFRNWNWQEGLISALALVLIVGTGLFTAPGGLTSVGNAFYDLVDGFASRPDNKPFAFATLIALRYEFGILLFGVIAVLISWRERHFATRFFTGWLVWSFFLSLLYGDPTPDAGLWLVVPAIGLTALLVTRLLLPMHSGYWADMVPEWGVAFHAIVTALLLVGVAINLLILGRATQQEAEPLSIERIEPDVMSSAGKLGAINSTVPQNAMQLDVPALADGTEQTYEITVQVVPIGDDWTPRLTVENNRELESFGPYVYNPDGEDNGIVETVQLVSGTTYFFRVSSEDGTLEDTKQFMLLTYGGDKEDIWWPQLDIPQLMLLLRVSPTPLRAAPAMFTPFLILLGIIVFLLVGSLWGPRAATRGLAFGVLGYTVVAGIGLGWQASHTYAGDPRELWQTDPVHVDGYERLAETLRFMSLQATGEPNRMSLAIQAKDDGALAWLVRDFDEATFVSQTGLESTPDAVIVPDVQANPTLGDDYIGQDFTLSYAWNLSDLSWTDFLAWLTVRETRLEPAPDEQAYLWVRKDVYGVDQIPTAP